MTNPNGYEFATLGSVEVGNIISNFTALNVKGTFSRDWDGLLVVWMDRALFGGEPMIVCKTFCCHLVVNFEFYFLQRYCMKVVPLYAIGATVLQMCQSLLATIKQICYGGSEGIDNPLAICFRIPGYWQPTLWQILLKVLATFANSDIFFRGLPMPCNPWA
jgi:hypothetical protein